MSELEFQRELSPEQIREALSLLDSTVGAENQNSCVEDFCPVEEVNREPDHSSTTMAMQDRPPAGQDPLQRKKHLTLVVACFGIAIVAAGGALALLSRSESVLPRPMPGIDQEQPPKGSAAPAANIASSARPVANPLPNQNPGGSERQASTPELAGWSGAVGNAANSDSAIPPVARSANQATGTSRARWNDRASRTPEHTWRNARAVQVAAAKKRFWRFRWQARADDEWCIVACRRANGEWCFFGCRAWRVQPVFYEPRRNVRQ